MEAQLTLLSDAIPYPLLCFPLGAQSTNIHCHNQVGNSCQHYPTGHEAQMSQKILAFFKDLEESNNRWF
jgi:hypothetical protein